MADDLDGNALALPVERPQRAGLQRHHELARAMEEQKFGPHYVVVRTP